MNKVVIVDDELIIVEGLTKTLPWEQWNCKIVATASDGEEGRKIIEQYHPDLVFSDIAFPRLFFFPLIPDKCLPAWDE